MTPKLRLKTPPFYTKDLELNRSLLRSSPHSSSSAAPRRTRHTGVKSELQHRLSVIVRRIIGTSHSHHNIQTSNTSLPRSSITPNTQPTNEDDGDDCSNYGDFEENGEDYDNVETALQSPCSLSSASSYSSLASLNPYVVDAADLGALLSPLLPLYPSPSPSPLVIEGERRGLEDMDMDLEMMGDGKHARDSARLAQQLDTAHAAVVAEEDAALRELRLRTRLG
ncbi:hypothetical protein F5Y08DRAFT_349711 [Xylaria arbuscula]|nr:hypothetical protein F5Y08DRAFT_349711 [Xylaria arbuscula]